ncbi:PREDICTED: transmembrane protein 134 isoform X10 [Bison bison bison]|uniref:Transmembrane protein 134 isoform X10 n=1 Tax=Bison bison bison TaxID=43346 RepID=A0A6P3H1X9_BISBB|nr:PREDICTED: transmembrane protein 134 isoform X10 [Bison bison bison]XP_027388087.1 transmembrane protein 134 isoform X8 [Bos indicus x Bos taurus]
MSASRPQFSIDDAFELSLEDTGPGLEPSGVARFGPLHFERRARFEVADEDKQSRLRYQNLENDEDGAQASPEPDGGVSSRSGPGILAKHPSAAPSGPLAASAAALSAPTMRAAGVSSAIFFVPGFLLLVPGVYHVIFIYCAVKGHRGFQFFYLPYFEK